jgi:NAD(P)-dependent dehydrogenase (short-subunit alcohol dehydrogenase family)
MIDCDVSDQHRVHDAASEVMSEFGPAEVLVNNAGVLRSGPLASLSVEEWNSLLAINLTGFFLCAQVFGSQMLEQRNGSIVHLSSIGGTHPTANAGAYSVAKAGIIMLSRQLAIEWGALGVRSNVVSPGLIRTPMTEAFYNDPSATEARQSVVPRGRIGTPEDIARAVVFLASPDADYITGQELGVDGGLSRSLLSFIPRSGYERG